MTQNIFYNFLCANNDFNGILKDRNINMVSAINAVGKSYMRLVLPNSGPINLDETTYTIREHHISIYESESPIPVLSQYHYTAILVDTQEQEFRLHVYFDNKGEIVINPVISKRIGDTYQTYDMTDYHDDFIELALAHSDEVCHRLRLRMAAQVSNLEAQFRETEANALLLQENLEANFQKLIVTLTELSQICGKLIPLVSNNYYYHVQKIVDQFKTDFEQQMQEHQRALTVKPGETRMQSAEATVSVSSPVFMKSAPTATGENYQKEIDRLTMSFRALDQSAENYPQALNTLMLDLYVLQLTIGEDQNCLKPALLSKQLYQLQNDLNKAGEQLINRLLLGLNPAAVAELSTFHHFLSEKFLIVALALKKPRILEVVLRYGSLCIDQPVTIHNKTYASALHYCFEMKDAHCFKSLLINQAPLSACNESGLPLLHIILSTPNHPLLSAIKECNKKPIEWIKIYKQLIANLSRYLARDTLTSDERTSISSSIAIYKNYINDLKPQTTQENEQLVKAFEEFCNKHKTIIGNIMTILRQDPDVIRLFARLEQKTALGLNNHSNSSQSFAERQQPLNFMRQLDKITANIPPTVDISVEQLKQLWLKALEKHEKQLDIKIRINQIRDELRVQSATGRRASARAQRLQAEQQELTSSLNILTKELDSEDLATGADATIIEGLSAVTKLIQISQELQENAIQQMREENFVKAQELFQRNLKVLKILSKFGKGEQSAVSDDEDEKQDSHGDAATTCVSHRPSFQRKI